MLFKEIVKKILPQKYKILAKRKHLAKQREYIKTLTPLSESRLKEILTVDLGIKSDDMVFIHSSMSQLNLSFPSYKIIPLLLDIVGPDGTILFPSYPQLNSYDFLKSGEMFNIKKTPSYTGILTEFARRNKKAKRSLHPTKSVVAIGKYDEELTASHPDSFYPYDVNSPYYKLTKYNGKVIGIGVKTTYLSCVHCVDDVMRKEFPVNPYHNELFEARCIDYDQNEKIVKTYAHNMAKMDFNLPKFMAENIPDSICRDLIIDGMNFFTADARQLIEEMIRLAHDNITIYHKNYQNRSSLFKF